MATEAGIGQNRRQGDYQGCQEDQRRNGARCRLDWSPRGVEADGRRGDPDDKRGEPPGADDAPLQAGRYRRFIAVIELQEFSSAKKGRCTIFRR